MKFVTFLIGNVIFLTVSIIFLSSHVSAQFQIPEFQTKLYFEDAVGNKDTITIGHDINASYSYSPEFGEQDINEPFDSIFEVRAGRYLDLSTYIPPEEFVLSKTLIGNREDWGLHPFYDCLPGGESIMLFVNAKYQPVQVTWDSSVFDSTWCMHGSLLSAHQLTPLTLFWWETPNALENSACMSAENELKFSLPAEGVWDSDNFIYYPVGTEDNLDTIYNLLYWPAHSGLIENQICPGFVSNIDDYRVESRKLAFPNPTNGILALNTELIKENEVEVFTSSGEIVYAGNDKEIDIGDKDSGLYLIRVTIENITYVDKIFKY